MKNIDEYFDKYHQIIRKNDSYEFNANSIPTFFDEINFNDLIIKKGHHYYDSYFKTDSLNFILRSTNCIDLALLIIESVFHQKNNDITIHLSNPESDIALIKIRYSHYNILDHHINYFHKADKYEYISREIAKHPWTMIRCDDKLLPIFQLTNKQECTVNDDDWKNRDTIIITGFDFGMILFADLLLNIGSEKQKRNEFVLEDENGFRGVGPGSAEVVIWLSGIT